MHRQEARSRLAPVVLGLLALTTLTPGAVATLPGQSPSPSPTSPQRLDTARVSVASRAAGAWDGARSVTVMGREEIERRSARSVADVVAWGLGVDLAPRSAAQADLAIRGSGFEQVLVLVDGVRVSDDQTGHFDLDLAVPLALVERVEVLRGAGSAVYGADAVGGVVNIVTRAGAGAAPGVDVAASARGGSFGTAGASGTIAIGTAGRGVVLGAEHERSDGHRADTDYQVTQARASMAHAVGAGTVQAELGLGVRDFGAADFYAPYPSHERTTAATAAVRWRTPLPSGWSLSGTASGRRHGDRFTLQRDRPELYQNHHVNWFGTAEAVVRGRVGDVALALGGEGGGSWLRSERLGDREAGRGALFAEGGVASASADMNAGLRFDWSSRDGGVLSPSLATSLALGERVRLRGSVSHGFRAPTWTERYYEDPVSVGDPELKPERFWAGELGGRAALGGGVELDVAGWVRRAHDLIDWARALDAPQDAPWRTRNVAIATFRGLEGELRLPSWRGMGWSVRGSTTAVRGADVEGWKGRYALRPLTRSLSAHVVAPLVGGLTLGADAGVAGHAGEGRHARADARLSYLLHRGARLTLDAVNLGDASYLDASSRPVAGRAFYLGAEWRW